MNSTTRAVVSSLFAFLLGGGASADGAPPIKANAIRPERELIITHPAVVDSEKARYPGAWSFGVLVEQLVGKEKAADSVASNVVMRIETPDPNVVILLIGDE